MPVETVVRHVELAADKPFGVWELPLQHGPERLEPVQHFCLFQPETLRIALGTLVDLAILVERFHVCALAELSRRRNGLLFENVWVKLLHESSDARNFELKNPSGQSRVRCGRKLR